MIRATFEVKENWETGLLGLAMIGRAWAEPLAGMAAAHDVLEHMPNDDGSVYGEIMAMGASFLVRGENYYFDIGSKHTSPGWHWCVELADQCRYIEQAGHDLQSFSLPDPGRTKSICVVDRWATEAVNKAREEWTETYRDDDEDMTLPLYLRESEQHKIIGWARKGWVRARRRFRHCDYEPHSGFMAHIFSELERNLDIELKRANAGQIIKAQVDVGRGYVLVENNGYPEE